MNLSTYISEIMKQDFSSSLGPNYTKAAILLFLKKNKYLFGNIEIQELIRYIYRFFVDNKMLASKMNYVIIKKIYKYTPDDIKEYVQEEIKSWIKFGSGVLIYDGKYIYTNPKAILSSSEVGVIDSMIPALFKKYYSEDIVYDDSIESLTYEKLIKDKTCEEYLTILNHSKFRSRVFETCNYCCCCDEANYTNLYAVHADVEKDLNNIYNSLVFCREHAELYYKNYFRFSDNGKIIILKKNPILDSRMHLSHKLLLFKKEFLVKDTI